MTLNELNRLSAVPAREEFLRVCGSTRWADQMNQLRPFPDTQAVFAQAENIWNKLGVKDWLEAFSHHPKIGDLDGLTKKLTPTNSKTVAWATQEQKGATHASPETLGRLAQANAVYEVKFGYIFLVCASGKSAEQMLSILEQRLNNSPEYELQIAAQEQSKITKIRLEKLFQ